MPKRTDIKKILIIGSGPIIISQACEFDYSGTQAIKALKEEGYEVVLINSNPATIMTDPEIADRTYIEPITPEAVAKVIEKERPDALLPTLGGQTGLNTAIRVAEAGILEQYGVELLAADIKVIRKAEGKGVLSRRHAQNRPQGAGERYYSLSGGGKDWRSIPSVSRSLSGRALPSAAPAAALHTTAMNSRPFVPPALICRSTTRSCSNAVFWAGKNTSWK